MSCFIHARFFPVALCFLSITVVFESLLLSQFTSQSPASPVPVLLNHDGPVEADGYTSVLLRAIRACLVRMYHLYVLTPKRAYSRCTPRSGVARFSVARVLPMGRRRRDDCRPVSPRRAGSVCVYCRRPSVVCRGAFVVWYVPQRAMLSTIAKLFWTCSRRVARARGRGRVGRSAAPARHGLVFKLAIRVSGER